jgi:hypothetical protein
MVSPKKKILPDITLPVKRVSMVPRIMVSNFNILMINANNHSPGALHKMGENVNTPYISPLKIYHILQGASVVNSRKIKNGRHQSYKKRTQLRKETASFLLKLKLQIKCDNPCFTFQRRLFGI